MAHLSTFRILFHSSLLLKNAENSYLTIKFVPLINHVGLEKFEVGSKLDFQDSSFHKIEIFKLGMYFLEGTSLNLLNIKTLALRDSYSYPSC